MEDSISQRIILLFDQSLASLREKDDGEDEIMIYHLLTCHYLCLKVENRVLNISFEHFLGLVVQLPSYVALQAHLVNDLEVLEWSTEIYTLLERSILIEGLRCKTDFVSGAQAIFEILCTYSGRQDIAEQSELNGLLLEGIFRSYICMEGKFWFRKSRLSSSPSYVILMM